MTLTNQNLMVLSKFAMKAKKHIGLVKAIDMCTNQQYANGILIKATLCDNEELINLTKTISSELNVGVTVISAVESYIYRLKAKGSDSEFIRNSKYYLIKLAQNLYGIKVDGSSYRLAVETLLSNIEIEDRSFFINLARDFYPLWINENKLLDKTNHEEAARLSLQKEAFLKLWNSIEQEFFSDEENWPLNLYATSMRQIGVLEKDIEISQKVAKVICIELRNNLNSEENYRNAINRIQQLFTSKEMKEFFLIVSREFYHFWAG